MRRRLAIALALVVTCVCVIGRAKPTPIGACTSPSIYIEKSKARLELRCREATYAFPVTFGASPVGNKVQRGDERTPEGHYHIEAKVQTPRFDRFLKVSYPSAEDRKRAAAQGVDPGGGIGIHGVQASLAGLARLFIRSAGALSSRAWGPTDGCIAMTNEDVEALYDRVPAGTPVTIVP